MNKHHQFWLERWDTTDIPFHQSKPNPDLDKYWSRMTLQPNEVVLVPLCGKSLDMVWLRNQGHPIIGIELSELAVQQFFLQQNLAVNVSDIDGFKVYESSGYQIWVADIFKLSTSNFTPVSAIYDRGSLIALPEKIRNLYAPKIIEWLQPEKKVFLKTVDYNQSEMDGPPYAVSSNEVHNHFKQNQKIELIKSEERSQEDMLHYFNRGCTAMKDETWIITK